MRNILIAAFMLVIFVPAVSHARDPWRDNHRGGWGDQRDRDWYDDARWRGGHNNHRWQQGNDHIVYISPPPVFYNPRPVYYNVGSVFYTPQPVFYGRPHCNRPVYYAPRPTSSFGLRVFGW